MTPIILQANNSVESRVISHAVSLSNDYEIIRVDAKDLLKHINELKIGLPIGSVEFIQQVMTILGIEQPNIFPYPIKDHKFLSRQVDSHINDRQYLSKSMFIKPQRLKAFNGFIIEPKLTCPVDYLLYDGLVWISEVVNFLSEYRYYIQNSKVLGYARYDDNEEEGSHLIPDISMVEEYAGLVNLNHPYVLDFGVLDNGKTALVEYNDFWAIGYYHGPDSITSKQYLELLFERWKSIVG